MLRKFRNISLASFLFVVLITGLFLVVVGVAQESSRHQPAVVVTGGMLSTVSADAIYVFDLQSGMEIFTRNENSIHPIASVTKLISAALFLEHATATDVATITWADIDTEGRSGRLKNGQQYLNKELLFPALLESSNDASVVMQRVSPVPLVDSMNTYARKHYLLDTHFTDASGLDDGNVSTAYELGNLVATLYTQYPHIFDITQLKTYLNHVNAWMNNNPFVHDEGYRGGKHGYTYAANRTTVAFFDETLQSGNIRTIGYVLLDSDGLQTDMELLRTYVQNSVTYK